ncbi:MAG TPA: hypothetical protein DDX39_02980 [Bacteroidales bacterium]|nr:MAG: hypothetical protein A2W98_02905 [Bacteroidetes bacterium GWF2_33_38]OFY74598.1 MAG: hypothetical protein A2265_03760 [Bacteroidetes bacterium RIFOXYA12_FULL_33_9]OFY87970.1 MAG: hypothetical protein A2236_03020 [Bacteroidetes bacterium RIFOXYA2_FULL_33_7]HBF87582.1 hypothetical protein [Bacteroidales bacterium]
MNKRIIYILGFIFFISFFFMGCEEKKSVKIIEERDSLIKFIEEHDSLRIVKENPDFRKKQE